MNKYSITPRLPFDTNTSVNGYHRYCLHRSPHPPKMFAPTKTAGASATLLSSLHTEFKDRSIPEVLSNFGSTDTDIVVNAIETALFKHILRRGVRPPIFRVSFRNMLTCHTISSPNVKTPKATHLTLRQSPRLTAI